LKILIFGLPGSGKTTLAKKLEKVLGWTWFNADEIRKQNNDWDFTMEGRMRQAQRMKNLSDDCKNSICDFVAPTENIRKEFSADLNIWMNTLEHGRFEDTNKIFEVPKRVDIEITNFDYNIEEIIKIVHRNA
jgi:adenylylsulfate kinase